MFSGGEYNSPRRQGSCESTTTFKLKEFERGGVSRSHVVAPSDNRTGLDDPCSGGFVEGIGDQRDGVRASCDRERQRDWRVEFGDRVGPRALVMLMTYAVPRMRPVPGGGVSPMASSFVESTVTVMTEMSGRAFTGRVTVISCGAPIDEACSTVWRLRFKASSTRFSASSISASTRGSSAPSTEVSGRASIVIEQLMTCRSPQRTFRRCRRRG